MAAGIESTITGADEALAELAALEDRLTNLEPLLTLIAAELEQNAHLRFETKRDPDGEAWRPWSEATREAREEEGRGTLLEYTGRMRDSLATAVGESFVEIFLGVPYAAKHEKGEGVPRRAMLASPSTGDLGAADAAAVARIVEDYING